MWSKSIELFNPYDALMESREKENQAKKPKRKKARKPFTGDQREVKRFAWYPMKINGSVYWMKLITIRQSYNTRHGGWCNDWVVRP